MTPKPSIGVQRRAEILCDARLGEAGRDAGAYLLRRTVRDHQTAEHQTGECQTRALASGSGA